MAKRLEAVASIAENLINFTNETGFEAFAVIQETADGFVVTDAVSTGNGADGSPGVDVGAALDTLGISSQSHDFRIGDLHTQPGTDFASSLFSQDDFDGNQASFDARDFMINNSSISSISRRFPGTQVPLLGGESGFLGRSVAKRNQSGGFTLNRPPRRRRR